MVTPSTNDVETDSSGDGQNVSLFHHRDGDNVLTSRAAASAAA
jgi:hypothetical protein